MYMYMYTCTCTLQQLLLEDLFIVYGAYGELNIYFYNLNFKFENLYMIPVQ